eukprot:4496169-Pyramimonas_sp.AAC.1
MPMTKPDMIQPLIVLTKDLLHISCLMPKRVSIAIARKPSRAISRDTRAVPAKISRKKGTINVRVGPLEPAAARPISAGPSAQPPNKWRRILSSELNTDLGAR